MGVSSCGIKSIYIVEQNRKKAKAITQKGDGFFKERCRQQTKKPSLQR